MQDKKAKEIFDKLKNEITIYEDNIEIMSYGLYVPQFDFQTSEEYKNAIKENIQTQKDFIKSEKAAICNTNWQVGGSSKQGEIMIRRYIKLSLRAFNGECDALIGKVNWNNVSKIEERIRKTFDAINKLGKSNDVFITSEYLELRIEQLKLTHEYELKRYEEKEEQKQIREQMREEERAKREIEKAQKEAEAEEIRYQKALEKAQEDIAKATGDELEKLKEEMKRLEEELKEAGSKKERALSMAQQTKSGHVYIISNIGSFGENIYKIGMTRRLEPLDRVKELGDASVPFLFDVHAMIYSENAPKLENSLHKAFENKKVNMINHRREFFNVTLSEIELTIKENFNKEIQFTKIAEAKEYRETQEIIKRMLQTQNEEEENIISEFPTELFNN